MKNNMLMKHAATVGMFAIVLYILCLLWSFVLTEPAVAMFHQLALKTAFPGFRGFDVASLIWGGLLSFVYGFIASVIFHSLHRNCCGIKS